MRVFVVVLFFRATAVFFPFFLPLNDLLKESVLSFPLNFFSLEVIESLADPSENLSALVLLIKVLHKCLHVILLVLVELNLDWAQVLSHAFQVACDLDHLVQVLVL